MLTSEQSLYLLNIQNIAFGRHGMRPSLSTANYYLIGCDFRESPAVFILQSYLLFLSDEPSIISCDEIFDKAMETDDPQYIYLAVLLLKDIFGQSEDQRIHVLLSKIAKSRYVDDGFENFIPFLKALWMLGNDFLQSHYLELFGQEVQSLNHDLEFDSPMHSYTCYDVMQADYLAQCYYYGMGVEKDIDRALLLAKLGSTFGYPASLYIQAKCMLKQLAASSENLANIEMVSACAVERSYAPAFSIVGSLNEGKNDIYAAIQYYRKGAALGCKEALQSLRRLKRSIDRKKPAATSRTVSIVSNLFVSPPLPAAPLEVLSASSCRSTIV